MTKVYLEADGSRHIVSAKGHAAGSPEACAALSCLLTALAGYLQNARAEVTACRLDSGDAYLEFHGEDAAFYVTAVGLMQLAQAVPEAVQIEARL